MKNTAIKIQKSYCRYRVKISFRVFSCYFADEEDFKIFLNKLSKNKQEKFFRLSEFYGDVIYNPHIEDKNIKRFFSLITIFSLIEATANEEKHKNFNEYLFKNFKPILSKDDLKLIEQRYFNEFGSQKQVKIFFDKYVDKECKKLFASAICFNHENKQNELTEEEKIKKNINLFYQWRSDFVHNAETPNAFRKTSVYIKHKKGEKNKKYKNNIITTAYTKEDFGQLFEHGFLRYFGYSNNFEHKNIEEKIKQYENHTYSVVRKKGMCNFKKILNALASLEPN